jgi:DNA gyrase subunit A
MDESAVRSMGRTAAGVRGMKFREGDELLSCAVVKPEATVLHLTTQGFGKRTSLDEFSTKGRGGLGVRGIGVTEERGQVAGAVVVNEDDDIFAVTSGGVIIRMSVSDISLQGRSATGVRVMNPDDGQHVVALSRVPAEDMSEDEDTVEAESETVDLEE